MISRLVCGGTAPRVVLALLLTTAAGCARRAELTLQQDFAPPSQRLLALESTQAFRSSDGTRQAVSLSFPLPGARQGPRAFVVYFEGPDGNEAFSVDPGRADAHRGFLVQEVGALKGKSALAGGTVEFRSAPLRPNWREVRLDVRTQDGAALRGKALVETAAFEVRNIRRRYAADIRVLRGAGEPATTDAPTDARPGGAADGEAARPDASPPPTDEERGAAPPEPAAPLIPMQVVPAPEGAGEPPPSAEPPVGRLEPASP
jgi:hypothetical protein